METYVVFYCGDMDDVPTLMTNDIDKAVDHYNDLKDFYKEFDTDASIELSKHVENHHPSVEHALDVMSRDIGTFNCISLGVFVNGTLQSWGGSDGPMTIDRATTPPTLSMTQR